MSQQVAVQRPARSAPRNPAKPEAPAKRDVARQLGDQFRIQSYRLVGKRLEKDRPFLKDQLVQAGLNWSTGMLLGMAVCLAVLAGFLFWVVALLAIFGRAPSAGSFALATLIGLAAAGGGFSVLFTSLRSRIQNRAMAISKELPFSLSELSVLASIGLAPIVLMRRMAERPHDPAMTAVFRAIVARVDTEGQDLVSAMAETARASPSKELRNILGDLSTLIHQGGDLEAFLRGQTDIVLEGLRNSQKSFTDRLGTYADIYITVVLLGVMFVTIGAFVVDAFCTTAGGLKAEALIQLMAFGFMPLIVVVLNILLSSAHARNAE